MMYGGAAGAAAIAQAVKASGAIVRMQPNEFLQIVGRAEYPVVVMAVSRVFGRTRYKYLTSYKGLAFYTRSTSQLPLPGAVELVHAKAIWIPA
jgi:hypothetical protein